MHFSCGRLLKLDKYENEMHEQEIKIMEMQPKIQCVVITRYYRFNIQSIIALTIELW